MQAESLYTDWECVLQPYILSDGARISDSTHIELAISEHVSDVEVHVYII